MLPSKKHVRIAGKEYELAEQVGSGASTFLPHYDHQISSLLANRQNVDGKPGRQNVRTEIFFYAQDDWAGGTGNKFYDPNSPTKFYRGTGNPRVPGYLAGIPQRTVGVSPTGVLMDSPVFASGGGYLYMANSDVVPTGHACKVWQTQDGITWQGFEADETADGDPNWNRNLAVDQGGRCYLVTGGPVGMGHINVFGRGGGSSIFYKESTSTHPTMSNLGPRGAAVHERWLYMWTGVNLFRFDLTAPHPVDAWLLGGDFVPQHPDGSHSSTGKDDITAFVASADVVNCGDGVAMFTSTPGGANHVYQFRRTDPNSTDMAFSQLWAAPPDAILWSMCYRNGQLLIAGNQDRGVTVWGIDLSRRTVSVVAKISPAVDGYDA